MAASSTSCRRGCRISRAAAQGLRER
jgi:hypothetical protein